MVYFHDHSKSLERYSLALMNAGVGKEADYSLFSSPSRVILCSAESYGLQLPGSLASWLSGSANRRHKGETGGWDRESSGYFFHLHPAFPSWRCSCIHTYKSHQTSPPPGFLLLLGSANNISSHINRPLGS